MDSLRFEDAALYLRVKRMEVLASNIANADTPGYQAKDIDFKAALEETQRQMLTVQSTNKSHLGKPQKPSCHLVRSRYRAAPHPSWR